MPTASCHPRDSLAFPRRSAWLATPYGSLSLAFRPAGWDDRIVLPPSGRPVLAGRSGEPSSRPNEARRPAGEPPPGTSDPALPTGHRATGARTATLQTAEFLVANPTLKWHPISRVVS